MYICLGLIEEPEAERRFEEGEHPADGAAAQRFPRFPDPVAGAQEVGEDRDPGSGCSENPERVFAEIGPDGVGGAEPPAEFAATGGETTSGGIEAQSELSFALPD